MKDEKRGAAKSKSEKEDKSDDNEVKQETSARGGQGAMTGANAPEEFKTRVIPTLFDIDFTLHKVSTFLQQPVVCRSRPFCKSEPEYLKLTFPCGYFLMLIMNH